nr:MAG TPA: hypothetical protein [Caudoviricetes sp.]
MGRLVERLHLRNRRLLPKNIEISFPKINSL